MSESELRLLLEVRDLLTANAEKQQYIIDRLDDIEEKLDDLNPDFGDGYSIVE